MRRKRGRQEKRTDRQERRKGEKKAKKDGGNTFIIRRLKKC